MQKTEHFQLNTWAPEDFVDLEQMNANFTALDAALYTRQRAGNHTQALAAAARGELANLMLARAHDGADVSFAESTLLETFSDLSGIASYEKVICAGGPHFAASGAALTLTVNYNDGGNSYPRKTIAAPSGTTTLATLTAGGWFSTQQLTIKYTAGGTSVAFGVYQKGTLLGQSETQAIASKSDKTTLNIPLVAAIDPNVPCELRAVSTGSGLGLYIWEMSLTTTETVHTSGQLVTAAKTVTADALRLYLRYAGTAPTVSYRLGSGSFTAVTPTQTRTGKTHGGVACTLAIYDIAPQTAMVNAAFALKLALPAADTHVYDYCAAAI